MATRTPKTRATRRPANRTEYNSRDLLLAGVGAVSLIRKQALRSIEEAGQNVAALPARLDASMKAAEAKARKLRKQAEGDAQRLRKQTQAKVAQLRKQAQAKVAQLRKQATAQVAPLQRKLDGLVVEVAAQAQDRFAPLFAKYGKKPVAKRTAKAPIRRKAVRKAA